MKIFYRIIDVWYNEEGDLMSMDGRFIRKLAEEMNRNLSNGRINKLYQLSRTDFLFVVHRDGVLSQWFLSLSLQNPRMHLSWKTYDKPALPTGFCMLLRKHLEGGVVREIGVVNEDRIIRAIVENRNDFGEKVVFHLIAELMGKYANLILTEPDGTIIDCFKRVSPFDGQQRAFLKGLRYELPRDGKLAPSDTAGVRAFFENNPELDEKTLVDGIRGFSPLSAGYFLRALSGRPASRMELFEEIENHLVEPTLSVRAEKLRYYFFDVFDSGEKKSFPSLSKLLDEVYFEAGQLERTKQVSKNIYQLIKREYEKGKDKLEKQTQELKEAKNGEIQRIYGDMVRQFSPSIHKGDDRLSAFSYELGKEVDIPLDRLLSPNENAMAYFRRYKKSRLAIGHLETQIPQTRRAVEYFDLLLTQVETASLNDLLEIADELRANRFLAEKPQKAAGKRPHFETFLDAEGIEIVVGKNNVQNDFITHQLGKPDEWWFHTKDIPGSHVLVRSSEELGEPTIRTAANLAALHSKARQSSSVPVDYTRIRNVKKIPGIPGSFVTYSRQKTIFMDPDPALAEILTKKK